MCNGSVDAPYTNPCAPVHIITGSGVSDAMAFSKNNHLLVFSYMFAVAHAVSCMYSVMCVLLILGVNDLYTRTVQCGDNVMRLARSSQRGRQ